MINKSESFEHAVSWFITEGSWMKVCCVVTVSYSDGCRCAKVWKQICTALWVDWPGCLNWALKSWCWCLLFPGKHTHKRRGVRNKEHKLPIIKGHTAICQELACHKERHTLCLLHTHITWAAQINMWTEPNLPEIQHSMNPVTNQQASINTLPLYKNNQRTAKHLYASYLFIKISFGHICSLHLI